MTNDTAKQVAPLKECLYSMRNRVMTAQLLLEQERNELLTTILEDIFCSAQLIMDNYCIKEE